MSNHSLTKETSASPAANGVPSFDDVVESIVQLGSDKESSVVGTEYHQLRKLEQALRNRKGGFGLLFAVCNDVHLRNELVRQIKKDLPDQQPVEVRLDGTERSLLEKLLNAPGPPAPLFVYGLENLLPSSDEETEKIRRESTLQELQLSREHFRKLARPLLLWMPEYAYTMIGQQAVDFWSWQSGAVFFTEMQEKKTGIFVRGSENVSLSGNISGRTIITGDLNVIPFQPGNESAYDPMHQLPPPPDDFTGRESELNDLSNNLVGGVLICGLGGVGKTALALKLAEIIVPRYPDAQFYLDLQGTGDNPLSAEDAMRHIIRAYRPMDRLPESLTELAPIYQSVLHGRRALLLMDNATDQRQVEPLISPHKDCVLLVTSRQKFTLPVIHARNLDVLPRADSIKLLRSIAPRIGDYGDEIARLCGDLPLALRVAGVALAKTRDLTPDDFARRLGETGVSHLKDVDAALNVSYKMLSAEQRRLWRALAVFPQTFDDKAAAAVWQVTRKAAQSTLSDLMKWSLVEFNADDGRYRLHDLARLFAEARLSEAGAEETGVAQRRFALHYRTVLSACQSLYLEGNDSVLRGLALFDQEWGNIQCGQVWAEARIEKDSFAAQLCMDYPNAGVYVLELRQHPRERIRWLEAQLAAARQLKRRDGEGTALGNLGMAWSDLGGTRKAIEFFEQSLAIAREIGDRRGEGNALGNLGVAYENLGETRKTIEFYEQVLTIAREIGDRRVEGYALGNLGTTYNALGEAQKAIEFYEQVLTIARETGDRRSEGNALSGFGVAYKNLGETRKAIEFYEQFLTIAREISDRRGEGAAVGKLGNAWAALGETRKAIEFYKQQLIIVREISDRRGEGTALWNMSLSVDKLGDRARAIALAEAALEILKAIESPQAEMVRSQLAKWRGQASAD